MRVRGKLNLAVERARDIHALMRDGGVDGLSIGFRVERARSERPTGLRRLEKLDLWEISVVTFPMLPGARWRPSSNRPGISRMPSAGRRAGCFPKNLTAGPALFRNPRVGRCGSGRFPARCPGDLP